MAKTRTTRRNESRRSQKRLVLGITIVIAAVVLVGTVLLVARAAQTPQASATLDAGTDAREYAAVEATGSGLQAASDEGGPQVEVPDVIGRTLAEARTILAAAGLEIEIAEDPAQGTSGAGDGRLVGAQDPQAGERAPQGDSVVVRVPAPAATASTGVKAIVCIDPGHQSSSDLKREAIGPGSSETKERVLGGTTGCVTSLPEYEVVLQIAVNLKAKLEQRGITVVMTRNTNDVSISNAERAQVANDAKADLFVRVHADGSTDSGMAGMSTLYPAPNQWTGPISADSLRAAREIQGAMLASTGAVSRGIVARDDITGFNWSQVPAVLVECGFMTNAVEDKLLASPHYQDKLAEGITAGILTFLGG